ncbi:MAG: carboxypeptidase regulatory-like domain-containing protein [Pseudomonadales bacterium]
MIATTLLIAAVRVSVAADGVHPELLFTGFDGDYGDLRFPGSVADGRDPSSELVGIIVDGRELDARVVYRLGASYYLPATLLGEIGVRGTVRAGRLVLITPGGEVEAPAHHFRDLYGELFFDATLLDEVLKVRWEFSPERYAFNLTLPWWQQHGPAADAFEAADGKDVQFAPSSFGLTQIRLDHTQLANDDYSYGYSNLLLRGRLGEGIWRGEVVRQDDQDVRAQDYYWMRDFSHVQALVGNQQVVINPLLPTVETTGAQALYSSERIRFDPYRDQTRSDYVRSFGIPTKEIEGISQPGAIAELRIDGRPVARLRVQLDGTYRFDQVPSNSLQFHSVKVHILDQRSMVEIDVQDFTQTPIDLLLDRGQTVAFAGAGMNGNPLDPFRGSGGEAAFALARYGLTEHLTLEAGIQSADGSVHQVAGISASLGRKWAATASVGQHAGEQGYSMDLYGRGERWVLNGRVQEYGEGFRGEFAAAQQFNELRYEYWISPVVSVGAYGRSDRTASKDRDFLLPGLSWRFGSRNFARIWPDFDGDYRVDVRTSHRERDWFEFVSESFGERAEYRYYRNEALEFFGRVRHLRDPEAVVGEAGAIWYPNPYDDRSLLAGSLIAGDGGAGYRLNWQTTVLPGFFSDLEIRDEPVATDFARPGLQVRWTLSLDLAFSGWRPMPARNDFIQSRAGSIGGRVMLDDGSSLAAQGVDKVVILIDGRPYTAVLRGRYFFVRDVAPGVHEVALGAEHLPMSYSPQKVTYRVRVLPAATTPVDFSVSQEFGLSGRVTDGSGAGVAGIRLALVTADGEPVATVRTDPYGYYQMSGLSAGRYEVRTGEGGEAVRRAVLVDDFVFDVDLTLAAPSVPASDALP